MGGGGAAKIHNGLVALKILMSFSFKKKKKYNQLFSLN